MAILTSTQAMQSQNIYSMIKYPKQCKGWDRQVVLTLKAKNSALIANGEQLYLPFCFHQILCIAT